VTPAGCPKIRSYALRSPGKLFQSCRDLGSVEKLPANDGFLAQISSLG